MLIDGRITNLLIDLGVESVTPEFADNLQDLTMAVAQTVNTARMCEACNDRGWIFLGTRLHPDNVPVEFTERCDLCGKFDSDEVAWVEIIRQRKDRT